MARELGGSSRSHRRRGVEDQAEGDDLRSGYAASCTAQALLDASKGLGRCPPGRRLALRARDHRALAAARQGDRISQREAAGGCSGKWHTDHRPPGQDREVVDVEDSGQGRPGVGRRGVRPVVPRRRRSCAYARTRGGDRPRGTHPLALLDGRGAWFRTRLRSPDFRWRCCSEPPKGSHRWRIPATRGAPAGARRRRGCGGCV
jgi:hypothetical protein